MCRFDDRRTGQGIQLAGPQGQVVARRPEEVPDVLAEVERASHAGQFAGGFVSYEAAPGLDPALTTRTRSGGDPLDGMPSAWFGLFAEGPPSRAAEASPRSPPPARCRPA